MNQKWIAISDKDNKKIFLSLYALQAIKDDGKNITFEFPGSSTSIPISPSVNMEYIRSFLDDNRSMLDCVEEDRKINEYAKAKPDEKA